MAISSSSGSNSFRDSSSSSSPSSSSSLSASSIDSIPESREPTPEWDPTAAYEALAPLHWDAEEFDFGVASEEDEPTTEGEDLQFLFQEELESGEDDAFSWEGADSSEEIGSPSSDNTAAGANPHQFLKAPSEGSEERSSSNSSGRSSSSADDNGDGNSDDDDDDDDDDGDAPSQSSKRRRCSDTYDW